MPKTKRDRSKDLNAALEDLSELFEYGALEASMDPAAFIRRVIDEIKMLCSTKETHDA